jgi:hypothetical protein
MHNKTFESFLFDFNKTNHYINNQTLNLDIFGSSQNKQDLDIPIYTILISILMYSLIFIIGFFGNALVIIIAILNRSNSSTHKCLVNLSIADLLLIVVCMPSAIVDLFSKEIWYFGYFLCKIIPWLEHTIAHASILTIVAISLERSLAVAHPLKAKLAFTSKRVWIIVIIIWILSSVSSIPIFLSTKYTQGYHRKLDKYVNICVTVTKENWQLAYLFSTLFLFYLIPCLLLLILYSKVVLVINNRNKKIKKGILSDLILDERNKTSNLKKAHTCKLTSKEVQSLKLPELNKKVSTYSLAKNQSIIGLNSNRVRSKYFSTHAPLINQKNIMVLLIAMMFLIIICLLPYRCFSLWVVLSTQKQLRNLGVAKFYNIITFCRVTFYVNSALNPIFYHIISKKFQSSFKKFLKGSQNNKFSINFMRNTSNRSSFYADIDTSRFLSLNLNNK